uniref:RNase H type-1 domain-containing protein n=1 Tax=Oryza barthii TaxID=65489 RepID=A0A0D3GY20_9ORYZ
MAMIKSLERVAELGMGRVVVETDAANLKLAISSQEMDRSSDGALFKIIRALLISSFDQYLVSVCPRICNNVADRMASFGAVTVAPGSTCYWSQAPEFL